MGAIVGVIAVAIIGTIIIYDSGVDLDPTHQFGAVFAAWVGGLVLFVIAGSVVAVVSLVRPENESFDARARILFRRQTGKHIDYIVSNIKKALEHYAETTLITVTIRDYDQTDKKFRISSINDTVVRSYLDDVETTYESQLKVADITPPPKNGAPNRLVYIRVAGHVVGTAEDILSGISKPISCRVDRDGTCEVSTMTEFWITADTEENTHKVRRYTQRMRWRFENLLTNPAPVKFEFTVDGTKWIPETLAHGSSRQIAELTELEPNGSVVFNYRILAS